MKVTIHRVAKSNNGIFGIISIDGGDPVGVTLERPWKDNQPQVSCIPAGTYHCIPHHTTKYPNTWEVANVPGRTAILIHSGNTINDTEGCIMVGNGFNMFGAPGIINSRDTLNRLRQMLPGEFDLEII